MIDGRTAAPLNIALVDDDPLVLEFLSRLLRIVDIHVTWTATSAASVPGLVRQSERLPDVVAIDIRMPGEDGHALTRRLMEEFPALRVVMLTSSDDPNSMASALAAGAMGYLVKTDPPENIALGLRAAASGLRTFSTTVGATLQVAGVAPKAGRSPLTLRETEVLALLSQSLTNGQIAKRLGISHETVKSHVSTVLRKLDVADRAGAVLWGVRHGVVT